MAKSETNGTAVFVKGDIEIIHLNQIVSNTAQTRGMGVLPKLYDLGYGVFEKVSADKDAIWHMLFSDRPEEVKKALMLVQEHEPSLVQLAGSLNTTGQLQPVGVRPLGKNEYDAMYGMRRILAMAYNLANGGTVDTIEAKIITQNMTEVQARLLAFDENDNRNEESPMDRAFFYSWLKKEGKLSPAEIGRKTNQSGQSVINYLKLLDPKIEEKRFLIHTRQMSIGAALKLLAKRKEDTSAEPTRTKKDAGRYRFPPIKKMVNIYDAGKKPEKMSDKEWELWTDSGARRLIAHLLGLKFSEFKPAKEEKGGVATATKTTKVGRKKAVQLLIALGKTNAATWSDEVLQEKLGDIVNVMDSVDQKVETDALQKLLDKLVEGYSNGTKVVITKE